MRGTWHCGFSHDAVGKNTTANGRVRCQRDPTFAEANHPFIYASGGHPPGQTIGLFESHRDVPAFACEVQQQHTKIALGLPSHADLIHSFTRPAGAAGISTRLPLGELIFSLFGLRKPYDMNFSATPTFFSFW